MADSSNIAVVTGASSGIGKAMAYEFASRGYDVFLTGRNEKVLADVAQKIKQKHNVNAEYFAADLADSNESDLLVKSIAGLPIAVLVNNAGFAVKGDFFDTSLQDEFKMLDVQLGAMLKLTKAILPAMRERKAGLILNVASVYSFSPVPQQAVYAACKSFIYSFSSTLRAELEGSGVSVSVSAPGITQTEFRTRAGIVDKKDSGMPADEVARISIENALNGEFLIVPGTQNKLFVFLTRRLPASLSARLINKINKKRGLTAE